MDEPLKVLVVDDDLVDRLAVRRALRHAGQAVEIEEAMTSAEAFVHLTERPVDCVFLDFNLPDGDGLQLLRRMRAAGIDAPVVMLTGHGDEQTAVELMKAGAADYLPKATLGPQRLAHSLRYAVRVHRAERQARRAEAEIRASEERLSRVLQTNADGITIVEGDGRITYVNPAAESILGVSADALLQRRFDDPAWRVMRLDGRQQRADELAVARVFRTGQPVHGEEVYVEHDSGRRLVISLNAAPLRDASGAVVGVAASFRDITAHKRAEAALREQARQAALSADVGVAITESGPLPRVLQRCAEALVRHLELGGAGLWVIDERTSELVRQAGAGRQEALPAARLRRGEALVGRVAAAREPLVEPCGAHPACADATGDTVAPSAGALPGTVPTLVGFPLVVGERLRGVLALLAPGPLPEHTHEVVRTVAERVAMAIEHDRAQTALQRTALELEASVEELRLANERLTQKTWEAERARQTADEANRAKSQFLAMMSHELRTPLNAIGGYTQLLELGVRGPITEEQRDYLRRIKRSQEHLLTLISDVLNFAKLEAGQVQLRIDDVPVDETLAGVRTLIEPQVRMKGLTYEYHHGDPSVRVRVDRERMLQVIINLLTNAVKFTEPGGRIELRWELHGTAVAIFVRDTGIGIPADQLDIVFEPFVQVGHRLQPGNEGVGLGLAISRDLARAMDGDLAATSDVGLGSTFIFTVPCADPVVPSLPLVVAQDDGLQEQPTALG